VLLKLQVLSILGLATYRYLSCSDYFSQSQYCQLLDFLPFRFPNLPLGHIAASIFTCSRDFLGKTVSHSSDKNSL